MWRSLPPLAPETGNDVGEGVEEAGRTLLGLAVLLVGEIAAALAQDEIRLGPLLGEGDGHQLEGLADLGGVDDGDDDALGLVDLLEAPGPRQLVSIPTHGDLTLDTRLQGPLVDLH